MAVLIAEHVAGIASLSPRPLSIFVAADSSAGLHSCSWSQIKTSCERAAGSGRATLLGNGAGGGVRGGAHLIGSGKAAHVAGKRCRVLAGQSHAGKGRYNRIVAINWVQGGGVGT